MKEENFKSEIEELDFEDEVCQNIKTNESLIFIPALQMFDPDAHFTCSKFFGQMASHVTESDLKELGCISGLVITEIFS